ncbi:MAG TPA: polysaccharide biosynthesis/export family protein [Nevskiaceae bacterium]|nr:polysaccharide biosynthesis/export family protein [Nevskiaceae bacterium]
MIRTCVIAASMCVSLLSGCVLSPSWLPSSGPNYAQVSRVEGKGKPVPVEVVDVDEGVARLLLARQQQQQFSEAFAEPAQAHTNYAIGPGDVIEVTIWETPPAGLFAGTATILDNTTTSRATTLPAQMVSAEGTITIPFAGSVQCAGKTPDEVSAAIVEQLGGRAHKPQVLVRLTQNNTASVTVVGEVANSQRLPLTARGERVLDALAAAGGVRDPVNKTSVQVSRGGKVQTLPLDTVIRDPKQNIVLQPGDVVTALHQPYSFSVLGATGKNDEVAFEGQGLSLAQALARAGGLQDTRADAQGVFIFRFEAADALPPSEQPRPQTPDGKIPVVYRVDLKDPQIFFAAQSFPVVNGDVLYVSNAPAAELQKFLNIVLAVTYPVFSVIQLDKISH